MGYPAFMWGVEDLRVVMEMSEEAMRREDIFNFAAGPAYIPTDVLTEAANDLLNYHNLGQGIGEISHRSKEASAILETAKTRLRSLIDVPESHDILFFQGGGTGQFSAVAYNMFAYQAGRVGDRAKAMRADYIVTGAWSQKAAEEAQRLGFNVNIAAKPSTYGSIPPRDTWQLTARANECAYVYYCDNETIHGVEFDAPPSIDPTVPLVADMSSNILSKRVDVSRFAIIYAGAQKNIGLTGITVCIVHKDILLASASTQQLHQLGLPIAPITYSYPEVYQENSLLNTLPIFTLHIANIVFQRTLDAGGVAAQEKASAQKSSMIYAILDKAAAAASKNITLVADVHARSRMNITFTFNDPAMESRFLQAAERANITQIKGHRSVGGIRVSLYNSVSLAWTQHLADFLNDTL